MSRLSVQCLGTPVVQHAGHPIIFPTRKALALLVYLAVDGQPHSREALSTLFWPNSPAARARGTLRSTLALLRQALSVAESVALGGVPHLALAQGRVRFDDTQPYDLDCQHLAAASAGPRSGIDSDPSAESELLAAVVADYRGDFLAGFTLPDAPDFDEWVRDQQALWHRHLGRVLARLALLQAAQGDLAAALDTTIRWVAHDPLDEAAYRQLMQLHFAAGDRATALAAYEACRAVLGRELATEPGPETVALARRLRAHAPPPARPAPPAPAGLLRAELPFVGRAAEHARLVAGYHQAAAGQPGVVVLLGEAGMGKTRLAAAFLTWAAAQGAAQVRGQAFENSTGLPYQPLVEALRHPVEQENAPADLLDDVWLSELSRLLPELRERYPDLPWTGDDAPARARLFEAITRLGAALAARAPLVLFLDDLQWADAASLDVLHYALRRWVADGARVLALLTLRTEALHPPSPAQAAPLAAWLAALERDLLLTRLPLEPLPPAAVGKLVAALADPPAPETTPLGTWLATETGGHPFFLCETLKALVAQGTLASHPGPTGGWRLDGAALQGPVPAGFVAPAVRSVITARLAGLRPDATALLAAAAVLGQGARFADLCAVGDLAEPAVLDALDDLLARGLLRESGPADPPDRYFFTHDKIRDVVYTEVGAARRRRAHRRALAALEATAPAALLAGHATAAGLPSAAFHYRLAAGDAALAVFATRDAVAHYVAARQLLSAVPAPDDRPPEPRARQRLYAQFGRTCELLDDWPQAQALYEEMRKVARTEDDPAMEAAALTRLAAVALHGAADLDPEPLLTAATAAAETANAPVEQAETAWGWAHLHFTRGQAAAAIAHGTQALALAQAAALPELAARSLNLLAYAALDQGAWAAAEAHGAAAARTYAALGNRALEADSRCVQGNAQIHLGRAAEGVAAARAALALTAAIDNTWGQVSSALVLTLGLTELGAYEEALALAQAGLGQARAAGLPPPLLIFSLVRLGGVYRALQRADLAQAAHAEAWALATTPGRGWWFAELVAAELCADAGLVGDWATAAAYARQALRMGAAGLPFVGLRMGELLTALARGGTDAEGEAARQRLAVLAETTPRYALAYAQGQAGQAAARGDSAAAREHRAAAVALAHRLGLPAAT